MYPLIPIAVGIGIFALFSSQKAKQVPTKMNELTKGNVRKVPDVERRAVIKVKKKASTINPGAAPLYIRRFKTLLENKPEETSEAYDPFLKLLKVELKKQQIIYKGLCKTAEANFTALNSIQNSEERKIAASKAKQSRKTAKDLKKLIHIAKELINDSEGNGQFKT